MAVRISLSPLLWAHHNHNHNHKPNPTSSRVLMLANTPKPPPTITITIRSSNNLQKVFEDKSSGVVCYRDDKGEITCEGYDEGPRLHQHSFSCYQRDGEAMVRLLKTSLLLVMDGELAMVDKDE